jgi:predicted ester cyclase
MSTEANKAVARRYFDEFLNEGKGDVGDDLFALNYRTYFPGSPGPLDQQEHDHVTITFFAAFPDGHFTVEDVIAEGDKVVSRYAFRGTHLGPWTTALGVPPTGKHVTLSGNEIFRIADGRIVEQRAQFDVISAATIRGGPSARTVPSPPRGHAAFTWETRSLMASDHEASLASKPGVDTVWEK